MNNVDANPAGAAFGIDVGSTTWKAVVVDAQGQIVGSRIEPASPWLEKQSQRLLAELKGECQLSEDTPTAATGYGRKLVAGAQVVTEVTCHARGAHFNLGRAATLLDIGGQDAKAIRIGAGGAVLDFAMNDKCAAGTGRFLEVILGRMQIPYHELDAVIARAKHSVAISSTCTVFAESEVISLIAQGLLVEDILQGLHDALATRVGALVARLLRPGETLFMSGGVALNHAMIRALERTLNVTVRTVPNPQLLGAHGAALIALHDGQASGGSHKP